MFRQQFLLTKDKNFELRWNKYTVGNYYLHIHPDLEHTYAKKNQIEIHLLGSLYDSANPELLNRDIIENLVFSEAAEKLFTDISKYSGEFILIYKRNEEILIFNDACALSEIYYDDSYSCFGTQPKLLTKIIKTIPHDDPDAIDFYTSDIFKKKCLFVGESTHVKNIRHLLPNHYINLNKKETSRFYPIKAISELPLDEVARRASSMIKGYIKAMSLRHNTAIAVTGGYDSRVLFLASLETKSKYYVTKHPNMTDSHYDISIPRLLTSLYNKDFHVVPENLNTNNDLNKEYCNSIDFPRYLNLADKILEDHAIINGNISEVARNYYGYYDHVSSEDLAFLIGYSDYKFPSKQYDIYLKKNNTLFERTGYHLLDMFYWEEKMGNWAAKAKTESSALGDTVVSPFNSRDLLTILLSVKRKYRDAHFNRLYDRIIFHLSSGNKSVLEIPVNPGRKQRIIRIMKKLGIYNLYRNIGLRTRMLQI